MSTYFISDLHLSPQYPHLTDLFFQFLQQISAQADALYILGDLFNVWLGNDILPDFQQTIIDALQTSQHAGTTIYFIHGNRDFLLNRKFSKRVGWTMLPEPSCVDIYGNKVLLMHGDTLCTKDTLYLRWRYWARQAWLKKLVLLLPRRWRLNIAQRCQHASYEHQLEVPKDHLDAQFPAIKNALHNTNANILIHGHTHLPSIHLWRENNDSDVWSYRYVLSDWGTQGQALKWNTDGSREFISI